MSGYGGYIYSYHPPEWRDDARMRVLMGPMPPMSDTVATASRYTFWAAAIHHWCRVTCRPTFTMQECEAAFRRGTQTPHCLPQVLQHMYREGDISPLANLARAHSRVGQVESWGAWGARVFINDPAHYAWGLVRQAAGWGGPNAGVLVNSLILKEMCDHLVQTIHQGLNSVSTTSLISLPQLYSAVGGEVAGGSADTLQLLVLTLASDGRATMINHRGTTFVKFIMPGDLARPEITEMELAEHELSRAQSEVESAVRQMTEESGNLRQQAKGAVQAGCRQEALSLLRRKKRCEAFLKTQLGALENISTCLQQLQHSRLNKQVLGAFRTGVEALKVAVGGEASPDGAITTLDELHQVLEDCDEVRSLVSGEIGPGAGEGEEEELEAELNLLLSPQTTHYAQDSMTLPDVPMTNPIANFSPPPSDPSRPVRYGLPNPDLTPEQM